MKLTTALAPAAFALALAACSEAEAPSYEADATDESGGELIVSEQDPNAVPVDLPETQMTPVPEDGAAEAGDTGAMEDSGE